MIRSRTLFVTIACLIPSVAILVAPAARAAISFVAAEPIPAPARPEYLASADLNGDGRHDVIVVSPQSNQVSVLLGDSASSTRFNPATVLTFGKNGLERPAVGDLNADGNVDVVVPNSASKGVWILLGQGNGSFLPPYLVQVGRNPIAVAIGNFDGVRNPDLAIADKAQDRVFIRLNDGQTPPQFPNGPDFQIGNKPEAIVAADFNRDGNPDIAALNVGGPRGQDVGVLIFERSAAGFPVFRPVQNFIAGSQPLSFLEAQDLNNDGVRDLVLLDKPATTGNLFVNILMSRGDGNFLAPKSFEAVCPFFTGGLFCRASALTTGDFDRNGSVDIAILLADPRRFSSTDALQIYAGRGDGGFVAGNVFSVGKAPAGITAGDLNGDGPIDLVVSTKRVVSVQAYVNVSTPGQTPNGAICVLGDECLSGRCTNGRCCATQCFDFEQCNVPGMEGVCVPVVEPVTCTVDFDCLGTCRDEPSRECIDSADCNSGDRCDPRGCRNGFCCDPTCSPIEERCDVPGFEGVCIPRSEIGEPCGEDADCITGFCIDGFCCNEECANGVCNVLGLEGICQPRLPLGEFCGDDFGEPDDSLCDSGICDFFDLICCDSVCTSEEFCNDDGFCEPFEPSTPTPDPNATIPPFGTGTPAPGTMTPTPTEVPPGGFCDSDDDCNSTFCVNEVCCLVNECDVDQHCEQGSGNCVEGPPPPTRTRTPTLRATSTRSAGECPDGFQPVGNDCVAVSRSGGCATGGGAGSGGNLLIAVLLPIALGLVRRRRLLRAAARVRFDRE